jgi:small subunit ribosomal protein S17
VRSTKLIANLPGAQWFANPKQYLVHDPNSSVRLGDVVAITPGWRTSKHKRHVVKHIIAPAGVSIEDRPPVPTLEERIAAYEEKRKAKDERREARRRQGKGQEDQAEHQKS